MSDLVSNLMRRGLGLAAVTLLAASCTQTPKPVPTIASVPPPLPKLAPVAPLPALEMNADSVQAAWADLKRLGYAVGKDSDDPAFDRAILTFQRDQGLTDDGELTPALAERAKRVLAELPKVEVAAAAPGQEDVFLYSDGSQLRQPVSILLPPPTGLISDAPANFLRPLRPGMQGSYHLGVRGNGGFSPLTTVTCRVEKFAMVNAPAGSFNTLPVTCRTDAKPPEQLQWRSFYAVKLGQVIRQEAPAEMGGKRELIAIRPFTANWPAAARDGLDWALSHALDMPASNKPVLWSSTAVPPHFVIHAYAVLSPTDAGLPGGGGASCRRFDLAQSGGAAHLYPGIACRNAKGAWALPQSNIQIAAPAKGVQAVPAL